MNKTHTKKSERPSTYNKEYDNDEFTDEEKLEAIEMTTYQMLAELTDSEPTDREVYLISYKELYGVYPDDASDQEKKNADERTEIINNAPKEYMEGLLERTSERVIFEPKTWFHILLGLVSCGAGIMTIIAVWVSYRSGFPAYQDIVSTIGITVVGGLLVLASLVFFTIKNDQRIEKVKNIIVLLALAYVLFIAIASLFYVSK